MLFIPLLRVPLKQNWICISHMTFQFPGGFFWTKVLPLHLHLTNGAIPKRGLPPFKDTIRFHQKISFGFHLHIILVNNMSNIMYIFFLIQKYEKHCELLNLVVELTDMQPVLSQTVFQKVHNIGVLTKHNFLISENSFQVLP